MSQNSAKLTALKNGFFAGIPIGLGYLAVSFSLGIAAKNAGLSPFQSFLASILCHASAGEYAGFTSIAAQAAYLEIAIVTLIANARYLLMSFTMSQRVAPSAALGHRIALGYFLTDEIFGISIARPGYLNPYYSYGAILFASPCWAVGTALGTIAGNLLPGFIVSALSVALYGMFLAVIIPPSRKSRIVCGVVLLSFAASYAASMLPFISSLSGGTRTIILTLMIASLAAVLFPVKENDEGDGETE